MMHDRVNDDYSLHITQTGIYLLKVNKRNTRTRYEISSKLTIKTPEQRLLTLNM